MADLTRAEIEDYRKKHLLPRGFGNALNDLDHQICDMALKAVTYSAPTETSTLEKAKDVAMKATLCAQIMLQNPVVVANEKARGICVDTRDAANAFLDAHPDKAPPL